jgi:hypothetical protein
VDLHRACKELVCRFARACWKEIESRRSLYDKSVAIGLALHSEKWHVDREGRTGRRIAELRLVECFGGFFGMAERRRLRPVQR